MKTVQQKIQAEISKLETVTVRHRVEAYRRTDSARALLGVAQDRHNDAIKWRTALLAILPSDSPVTVRTMAIAAKWHRKWSRIKVYSVAGKDVAIVQHHGAQRTSVINLDGRTIKEYFTELYTGTVRIAEVRK